jgi:zinc protease
MNLRPALIALACAVVSLLTPAQATTIERVVSPGGIEAWLVREPSVPLIAMDFAFKGGSSQDPKDKPGVAYLAAGLLDDGAGDLTANAFHQRMEELAVELRFAATHDHITGSIRLLRERRDASFDLLRLALTAPRFDADAIERGRAQMLTSLRRESTNPNNISSRLWWRAAFPDHPYGRPANGTPESVPLIGVDDLRDYVKRVLARDKLKISVVGDIDAPTLGVLLDRVFGALPSKAELVPVPPATMQSIGRRMVEDLDVKQTVLSFGGIGIARKDPDFIPAYVVNHILGGGSMTSRLYNEVREKRGLAYGVYTYLAPLEYAALFSGGTQTENKGAAEALTIIESEIRRMAEEGPTADELAKAKAYLKGSYGLSLDTSTKIAAVLLRIQLDGLGIDYIAKRNGLIDAVTLADAKRVAKRLGDSGLLVTVVGRPAGLVSKEP